MRAAQVEIVAHLLVGREVGVHRAELRHHVRDDRALVNRQAADGVAGELDGAVLTAVDGQVSQDVEHHVFGGDAGLQRAGEDDLHGFGDAQPEFAGRPERRHLGATDAHPERAEPAEMGRVTVRAEDHLTGQHERFLADHLMADAAPDLEEMPDALIAHPLADFGVILGVERGRRGDGVVERDDHPLRVGDALRAGFGEDAADGGGVVVAEDHVGADDQHVTGVGGAHASGAGEDFLGKGESGHESTIQ